MKQINQTRFHVCYKNLELKLPLVLMILLIVFSNLTLFSQPYKTISIEKDIANTGKIESLSIPDSNVALTFLERKNPALHHQINQGVFRKTNKIVLFRINLKDYNQNEQLFVRMNSQLSINKDLERPLISVFYDTSSTVSTIPEIYCNNYYELLNTAQQLSLTVDTNQHYLYIVIAFPDSFNSEFSYSVLCKTRELNTKNTKGHTRGKNAIYWHPYDYVKQPPFFVECGFYDLYFWLSYSRVNLNDPAFVKPQPKEVSDSLFYNKWITKFLELAQSDTAFIPSCSPPMIPIEMHFDTTGKLVHYPHSDFSNLIWEGNLKIYTNYFHLLTQSFPYEYSWTPALDYEGKAIEYTRTVVFISDFCWN